MDKIDQSFLDLDNFNEHNFEAMKLVALSYLKLLKIDMARDETRLEAIGSLPSEFDALLRSCKAIWKEKKVFIEKIDIAVQQAQDVHALFMIFEMVFDRDVHVDQQLQRLLQELESKAAPFLRQNFLK